MGPKTKKNLKKPEIAMETITGFISLIKSKWPEYPVTAEDLRRPTAEFVLTFYDNCLNAYLNMLYYTTRRQGTAPPPQSTNLCREDWLYVNLVQLIPPLRDSGFNLGDLYIFDPFRSITLMQIVMHYISFADATADAKLDTFNEIYEKKEQLNQKKEYLEKLHEEFKQKYTEIGLVTVKNQKLVEAYESTAAEFASASAIKKEKDKASEEIRRELDKLQEESSEADKRNQQLEEKVTVLKEQIVTEEEHEKLKSLLENKKREEQKKEEEEVDIGNWLKEHKSAIDHIQTCLMELKGLSERKTEIFKFLKIRQDQKEAQQSYQYTVNITKGLNEAELNQQTDNLMQTVLKLEKDNKNMYEQHLKAKEHFSSMEKSLVQSNLKKSVHNQNLIEEFQTAISKQEAEIVKLKTGLDEKQTHMKKVLERTIASAKEFFTRFSG